MKRRLGIAQALIASPKIVLVDEPTAGLDPAERIRFRNLLRSLSEERIVILSTHIVEDIAATCSSLAVIKNGHATSFPSLQALASQAKGKVWKWKVRSEQYNQLHMKGEVISTEVTTDAVELRVLSTERPDEAAVEVNPTIEEGYLVWNQKAERIL
ncbi:ATPase component [Paenibacillus popilliae ATCC 14706]|uniref:ATPase component n=2 Tax=Paenibacillus popilliae TaxID=78057 RepID=M9L9X3_PAEPP|nr:ATPase component [Paenibacillus popilliae ATCC 14706]